MKEWAYTKYLLLGAGIILLVVLAAIAYAAFRLRSASQTPVQPPRQPITQQQILDAFPPPPKTIQEETEVKKEQTRILKTLPPPPTDISDKAIRKQQEELLRLLSLPPK